MRPTLLLIAGAAAGVVLAAAGLVGSGQGASGGLSRDAVARVNGQSIRTEDYQRLLDALAQDRRDGIDDAQRRLVLDRLIDEELLVQRALELGLVRTDSKIRKDLTSALIDSVVAARDDVPPSDRELQAFYEGQRDFFARPGRLRVRQVWCRAATSAEAPAALQRAQQAAGRLRAGDDFVAVRDALGDPELAPLPDALLPATKLGDYLGPTAVRAALSLEAGAVTDPVRSNSGYHVLQVVEQQPGGAPSFDDVKPQG
jgi:parvulin-like peptidyl-prolyl isomerase